MNRISDIVSTNPFRYNKFMPSIKDRIGTDGRYHGKRRLSTMPRKKWNLKKIKSNLDRKYSSLQYKATEVNKRKKHESYLGW